MNEEIISTFKKWKRSGECCDVVKNYYNKMLTSDCPEEEIKKVYSYVKEVLPEFFIDGFVPCMHSSYDFLKNEVIACEELLDDKFILPSDPVFSFYDNSDYDEDDVESILNYIVHHTRRYLVLNHSWNKRRPVDINSLDLENDCVDASNKVKQLCDEMWLDSHVIGLYPGYDRFANLFDGRGFHMLNIVEINNEYYLIDCTYRQFFTLRQSLLERLGIVDLAGVKAGRFMMMNEERKSIAETILKNGWIKLDENVLKHYLDGFTLSYRNGLYYEETGDFSYTVDYDVDDYIKFLRGEDSQINHEDKEVLGYQKKPLKNSNLKF